MQLGFMSAILPELSLEDVFRTAAEIGYDCVELMCWPPGQAERRYAGVSHLNVETLDEAAAARLNELTARYGVSVSGLGYYPNPLAPDESESARVAAHLRRVIISAARLGLGQVNTFVGRDWTKPVEANWPRFLEVWKPLVQLAEEQGVRIGIENCPMLFSQDEWPGGKNLAVCPAIWRRMFDSLPSSRFGLNYDPSHLVWQQMDYLKPLFEFRDRLFHVHAKDVRIDRHRLDDVGILAAPLDYHSPKLPGLGTIDWGRLVSVLGDVGYRGAVCVEVEDRAYAGSLERRTAALKQSYTFLRNFIAPADQRDR
jgi:sugar phosphate isomerase/epimerase